MSILIKGMEMPTRCFACPMRDVEYAEVNCAIFHGSYIEYREVDPKVAMQERPSWCPLVEVPPHGRLIDADALLKLLDSCMFPSDMVTTRALSMATNWLKDAPTVIPADKEGEE